MLEVRSSPTPHGHAGASVASLIMVSLLSAGSARAEPNIHILRQVTQVTQGDLETPRVRMQDAGAIAFTSDADVLRPGSSSARREIYLWTEESSGMTVCLTCDCPKGTVTDSESYDVSRPTDNVNAGGRPDIILFVSSADLAPTAQRNNADGNPEIFIGEINRPCSFHQLTDTVAPVVNAEPFASDNGRCIVFRSNADLADDVRNDASIHPDNGYRNPDGSHEVFMYSKLDGTPDFPFTGYFAQMSNGPAGTTSAQPVVGGYWWTRQCSVAAFQSDYDQLPNNGIEDLGGTRIFFYRRTTGQVESLYAPREVPHGFPPGNYQNPHISSASPFARGPHIIFEAGPDLWNNNSTGNDVFRYRIFHPHMTQYSNVGNTGVLKRPVVSDGGGIIVFDSTSSHVARARRGQPGNDDGNTEIFRLKGRRKVWQITKTTGCENTHASIRDDGRAIVFRSTCDLIAGRNPAGAPQVFMWQLARKKNRRGSNELLEGCPADPYCVTTFDGSLEEIFGRQLRPPRDNCLDRGRC